MAIELLDEETQKLVDKIEKMLRLAANNPNAEERAVAEAKAHEWLLKFNIDMATVEQHGGTENGRRADENLKGGHYDYQRDLWRTVADLNFCMYFNIVARIEEKQFMKNRKANQFRKHVVVRHERQHRLVGRIHNIILTRTMCEYMEQAIEREVAKQCQDNGIDQMRGQWANSFRRGAFERVNERIVERKHEMISEDRRKAAEAQRKAAEAGDDVSRSKAVGFVTLREDERDKNRDFLMGEDGYSAKMRKQAADDMAERALARAEAEAEATQWAADHPEEAAAEEKARRTEERRRQQQQDYYWRTRGQYSRERGYGRETFKGDRGGYYAGRDAGNNISIDAQTAGRKNSGSLS